MAGSLKRHQRMVIVSTLLWVQCKGSKMGLWFGILDIHFIHCKYISSITLSFDTQAILSDYQCHMNKYRILEQKIHVFAIKLLLSASDFSANRGITLIIR